MSAYYILLNSVNSRTVQELSWQLIVQDTGAQFLTNITITPAWSRSLDWRWRVWNGDFDVDARHGGVDLVHV